MKKSGLLQHQTSALLCSLISCGVFYHKFRATDVMFWYEFFSDALQLKEQGKEVEIHAMQVNRIIEKLEQEKVAQVTKKDSKKSFTILPAGILSLLKILLPYDRLIHVDEALMIQYFLTILKHRFIDHFKKSTIPESEYMEVFQPHKVYDIQISFLDKVIADTKARIRESQKLQAFLCEEQNKGKHFDEIIKTMPSEFSYRLSYRKPYREWLSELPPDIRDLEINHTAKNRKNDYYEKRLDSQIAEKNIYLELISKSQKES
ncbi:MAG: hypothetical protein HQK54_00665 [Oligoflexales bacterium]|nr:hypothetical protein [Oligoflexales bacterium]